MFILGTEYCFDFARMSQGIDLLYLLYIANVERDFGFKRPVSLKEQAYLNDKLQDLKLFDSVMKTAVEIGVKCLIVKDRATYDKYSYQHLNTNLFDGSALGNLTLTLRDAWYICEFADINSLQIRGSESWINDEIVNYYFGVITTKYNNKRHPDDHIMVLGSLFYKKLTTLMFLFGKPCEDGGKVVINDKGVFFNAAESVNEDEALKELSRWTRESKIGRNIFKCKTILIPVHVATSHWVLMVLSFTEKKITFIDSSGFNIGLVEFNMKKWLCHEYKHNKSKHDEFIEADWTFVHAENVPKQTDNHNCGPFVCMAGAFFVAGYPYNKETFTQTGNNDMKEYRKRILFDCMTFGDDSIVIE